MTTDRDHMFDGDHELDEQESRIQELKRQAEGTSGGETLSVDFAAGPNASPSASPNASPAAREQFWATVPPRGAAPPTSEYEQLQKQGVALPPPEQLDDAGVAEKVAEIVDAMSKRNVFLEHTDHLSDRALYEHLYRETLHETRQDVPAADDPDADAFFSYDLVGTGNGEDHETFLRFYADDQTREQFKDSYPDGLPPRQPRPFDRDRHLPQPGEQPLIDDELPMDERWLGDDTVR
jgi:hypothetical protein